MLLCLAVYLPGLFHIPPIDRDESRFAQASRQMFESLALPEAQRDPFLHSGGPIVPMVQGRPRLNKPPLIYWLQAASAWILTGGDPLRDAIWMYRIPGVLCAIFTVLITWRLGLTMFDPRAALLGAALLAVCPLMVIDTHQARADQLLLLTTTGTQFALWRLFRATESAGSAAYSVPNSARDPVHPSPVHLYVHLSPVPCPLSPLLFWLFLSLGILAKGPVTPMIAALTCVALSLAARNWRWLKDLRPLLGIVIVLALVAPWVYAVAQRVGFEHYLSVIYDETLGRSLSPKEGHWGPPGYHTVLLAALFWPGSLLTLAAVARALRRGFPLHTSTPIQPRPARRFSWLTARSPGRRAELFLLAWIIPAWLVFELIGTKLPHYTMPMYPALALLSARAVLGASTLPFTRAAKLFTLIPWLTIGIALCIALPLYPFFLGVRLSPWTIPLLALWIVSLIVAVVVASGFRPMPTRASPSTPSPTPTPSLSSTPTDLPTPRPEGARPLPGASAPGNPSAFPLRPAEGGRTPTNWLNLQLAGLLALIPTLALLLQGTVPWTKHLWPTTRIMELLAAMDHEQRPIAATGYTEDSLVFSTRARLIRLEPDHLYPWLDTNPTGLAIIPADPPPDPARAIDVGDLSGWNYSTGKRVDLLIVEKPR